MCVDNIVTSSAARPAARKQHPFDMQMNAKYVNLLLLQLSKLAAFCSNQRQLNLYNHTISTA
jgi:hypothetical protein